MRNYINVLIWFNGFLDNDDNDGDNHDIDLDRSPLYFALCTLKDMNNVKRL